MFATLPLALLFSVAPWTQAPSAPAPPPERPVVSIIHLPVRPPEPPRPPAPKPVIKNPLAQPHSKLMHLKIREMTIWKGLLKNKTAEGFYQLGSVRLEIANE